MYTDKGNGSLPTCERGCTQSAKGTICRYDKVIEVMENGEAKPYTLEMLTDEKSGEQHRHEAGRQRNLGPGYRRSENS